MLKELKCAAARVFAFTSAPADTPQPRTSTSRVLAVCEATTSVLKEELLSLRASRATRRSNRSSRPSALEPASECLLLCQRPH